MVVHLTNQQIKLETTDRMKLTKVLTITAALLVLAIPGETFAKGGKKGKEKTPLKQAITSALNLYDKDSNGVINGDEIVALRAAFAADKTGPLGPLDVNADGTLDDNEIAAIHKGKGGKKEKKGKKGKKDKAATQ